MSAISDFYSKLRAILGASYSMIILFMFLPFMVVSCGEGDTYTVLTEQAGTSFLLFELPEGRASDKAEQNQSGIYTMAGLTWGILLTAIAGLALVVKNADMKKTGFIIGMVGTGFAVLFMILLKLGEMKMKEDMSMINIEIGSGLSMAFFVYLATGIFAKLQKKPEVYVPKDDLPLEGFEESADAHTDPHTPSD